MLARSNPELAAHLLKEAQDDVERQWRVYSARAAMPGRGETPNIAPPEKVKEPSHEASPGGEGDAAADSGWERLASRLDGSLPPENIALLKTVLKGGRKDGQ